MISYLKATLKNFGQTSIALRWRLRLFLLLFVIIIFCVVVSFLIIFDVFSHNKETQSVLDLQLKRYEHRMNSYFGGIAANGLYFSRQVAKEIDRTLFDANAAFADAENNQKLIALLEKNTYNLLYDALRIAECSGAFIILNTTVNTNLPNSQHSRSGTYLKLANVNSPKPVNPTVLWARGIHELGHENNHIFHNKWQLEFDISRIPFYNFLLENASKNLVQCYYYSAAFTFYGTWEKIMLLCVPIVGKDGSVYGICGFEINSIFFKLLHAETAGRHKRTLGLVAQKEGETVLPGTGLEFGTKEGYYAGLGEGRLVTEPFGALNRYRFNSEKESTQQEFVGLERKISLSPLAGRYDSALWTLVCMVPKEDYDSMSMMSYLKLALFCVTFFVTASVLTYYISKQFNVPILQAIEAFKDGVPQKTYINEIDDLFEFLATNDTAQDVDVSAFYAFKNNIKKLSRAETAIFNLYMEGYSAAKIAEMLYVSINTIKSHNKNIYRKLNVSSRKELMVYAQMMKTTEES